jgi:hypothetical protein
MQLPEWFEGDQDLVLAQNGQQEAEDVEAGADVDVVGLQKKWNTNQTDLYQYITIQHQQLTF